MRTWAELETGQPTWAELEAELPTWANIEAGPLSAAGASSSAGSAAARLIRGVTAAGASTSSGSAAARARLQATASGSSSSIGTAGPVVPIRRAAGSGTSSSTGSAAAALRLQATAAGSSSSLGSSSGETVTTARLAPDTIAAATNLEGAVGAVQDSPDAPDGSWLLVTNPDGSIELRVTFPTPAPAGFDLIAGADRQRFRVLARAR